ncbi:MAG: hypothetical protein DBW62_07020, partial [Microbacterium sp.]
MERAVYSCDRDEPAQAGRRLRYVIDDENGIGLEHVGAPHQRRARPLRQQHERGACHVDPSRNGVVAVEHRLEPARSGRKPTLRPPSFRRLRQSPDLLLRSGVKAEIDDR